MARSPHSTCALLLLLAACEGGGEGGPSPARAPEGPPEAVLTLRISYGSEKKSWFEDEIKNFEATGPTLASGKRVDVEATGQGSGEAMLDILSGKASPHVYSPASSAYLALLNDAWLQQAGHTAPLAPAGDPLLLSPVVLAMWKPMAEALGWPDKAIGWKDMLAVSAEAKGWGAFGHPEWGLFKLAHTHPGLSNSGLLALVAEVYAGAGKTRDLLPEDLAAPATAKFLSAVEASLVHYGKSTSFLAEKMSERGPSYVSAAVLYENLVVESYQKPAELPLVAVYPVEGTFWSDHPYVVLDAPQVGAEEREAAKLLSDFLHAKPAQEAALRYGFRPADPAIAIAAPIDAAHGVDPLQPQTLLDVPDGPALSQMLKLWEENKKAAEVVLVFDKSGSMRGEPLVKAKAGASAFLDSLGDRDRVSLLFFDSTVATPGEPVVLGGGGRESLKGQVGGALADGGTALYDAVSVAFQAESARAAASPEFIHAVVVMTDGNDENSRTNLDALRQSLGSNAEAPVKVFTIGYGAGADPSALKAIAETGKGSFAAGDEGDIDAVFRDMAAFF